MERFHSTPAATKMHPRPLVPDSQLPPGLLPFLSPAALGTHSATPAAFPLTPNSLARLAAPCFNRRLFAPEFRSPKPEYPTSYLEWGQQLHADILDRYHSHSQRYQLTPPQSRSPGSAATTSPQPEDLSVNNRRPDSDSEDDEPTTDQSKSPVTLKFSIDAILGSRTTPSARSPPCARPPPALRPGPDSVAAEDSDLADRERLACGSLADEMGDKVLDGILADSERFSWLQCTRYKPPKLPRSKKKDGSKKRKLGRNPRVPFTQHQVNVLEQKFRQTHYLSSVDVAELSAALNLTETRVKIWFQNRRARERRDRENIQLLQGGGGPAAGQSPKAKPAAGAPGIDRLSPPEHRSPREPRPTSPGPAGMLSPGLHLPPGTSWPGPILPKTGMLGHFPGVQNRTSAFSPVNYFSFS